MTAPPELVVPRLICVLLGDESALLRAGLARLLIAQPGLSVVAEVATCAAVLAAVVETTPHVIMLNPNLPGDVMETAVLLRTHHPQSEILFYGLPENGVRFLSALQFGVKGFVDESADAELLITGIHGVAAGEVVISPRLAQDIPAAYTSLIAREQSTLRGARHDLTDREIDILRAIAGGHSNSEVAAALGLSEHTVRAHLRSISRKLGAHNRLQAVSEAIRAGLIPGERMPTRR